MLVPPRQGQRNKSKVMSHFNDTQLYQLVEISNIDGSFEYGVLDATNSKNDKYFIWRGTNLIPEEIDFKSIRAVQIPHPPKHAIEEFIATIGGIGKHYRWKVVISKKIHCGECILFVTRINDKCLFEKFVKEKIQPFGFCEFNYETINGNVTTTVNIPNHKDLTYVAAAFHCAKYEAIPLEDDMASCGNLGIERYDRSEHTWWNQNQEDAGPLRDTHKWKYNFIPKAWKHLPFTWFSLAKNINVEVDDLKHIPLPLRNYVCANMITGISDDHTIQLLKSKITPYHCVTSRLSKEQNIQLLQCTYWTFVAPFDPTIVSLCSLLQFRYMLHGYVGREMGGYRQTAKYIGHGAYCRKFNGKPQYDYKNLENNVKNKLECKNGIVTGNGFKGTRGKYGHKSFPKYKPNKKMKRSLESELSIREVPSNTFDKYRGKQCETGKSSDREEQNETGRSSEG